MPSDIMVEKEGVDDDELDAMSDEEADVVADSIRKEPQNDDMK